MSDLEGMMMRQLVDNLREEVKRLERELTAATERNGNLSVELAAITAERDALRRENDAVRTLCDGRMAK